MEKIWVVFKNTGGWMKYLDQLRSVLLELSAEAQGRLRQVLDPDGGVPAASKSPMLPDWRCLWAGNVAL